MHIAFTGFKKALFLFWDDSLLLVAINVLCFLSLVPALIMYNVMISTPSVIISILNLVLILPLTFFLFALYAVLFDARRGIHVEFKTYFGYLRTTWRQALIFGSINLMVALLIVWNLRFYGQFESEWAGIMQLVFVSVFLVWFILQLVMLPMYPRLEEPNFKLALRNSAGILGGYLIPAATLVILVIAFLALTLSFQVIGIFFTFSFIATMSEGIIGEVVIDLLQSSDGTNLPPEP